MSYLVNHKICKLISSSFQCITSVLHKKKKITLLQLGFTLGQNDERVQLSFLSFQNTRWDLITIVIHCSRVVYWQSESLTSLNSVIFQVGFPDTENRCQRKMSPVRTMTSLWFCMLFIFGRIDWEFFSSDDLLSALLIILS